jgi:hypothetical protein
MTARSSKRGPTFVALAGAIAIVSLAAGATAALTQPSGHIRGVVTFVGDSNETLSASHVALALSRSPTNPYAIVDVAQPGVGIRAPDCTGGVTCTTYDWWKYRITDLKNKVQSNAYVVDLGIIDTAAPGDATTPGYAFYGQKIDWLMALLGSARVYWTNLPCAIEPPARSTGCVAVNTALTAARVRHPNLTVLGWKAVAEPHPEWILPDGFGVHFTSAGYAAWAALVATALDARFNP